MSCPEFIWGIVLKIRIVGRERVKAGSGATWACTFLGDRVVLLAFPPQIGRGGYEIDALRFAMDPTDQCDVFDTF